jgi:PBP1b-binding outer membrane lipoprotein LpoB
MKYLIIAVAMLTMVGCSNSPTKLERIEANEASIASLQAATEKQETAIVELQSKPVDTSCPAECVIQIDRAFQKSQYK